MDDPSSPGSSEMKFLPRPTLGAWCVLFCAAVVATYWLVPQPSLAFATSKAQQSPNSWVPPIGIPEPSFGIRELAPNPPSPWISPTRGFYYVAESEGGTDERNEYGTPTHARRTIPLELPAGSVVVVHGTYSFDHLSPQYVHVHGTSSAPVFIRGVDTGANRPTVTRSLSVYGSYAIVENVLFDHSTITAHGRGAAIGLPNGDSHVPADCSTQQRPACADHIVFRHNELRGSTGQSAFRACGGLNVGGWVDNLPRGASHNNVVFWDNYIHDEGQMDPPTDDDQPCSVLNVGRYASHVWIVDNRCFNVAQSCVQIVPTNDGSAYNDTHHIYVGRNESNRASKAAFWVKAASDVIFSQNIAHDTVEKSYNPSTAFGLQYGPQRVWFLFNEAYNVTGGIWMASDSNGGPDQRYFLIGNVLHDITNRGGYFRKWDPDKAWSSAAIFDSTGRQTYIADNLIFGLNEANGINKPPGGGQQVITNNIITGLRQRSSWTMYIETDGDFGHSIIDYNVLAPVRVKVANQEYTSRSALRSAAKCVHCSDVQPKFRNAEAGDYAPTSDSPASRSGAENPAYEIFQKLYGIDIRRDFTGRPRTHNAAWDIGPFGSLEARTSASGK